jgi:hypothetical protein
MQKYKQKKFGKDFRQAGTYLLYTLQLSFVGNIHVVSAFAVCPIQCFHMPEGGKLNHNTAFSLYSYQEF